MVFAADELSDAQMLTVAKETNQSETAFIVKSTRAEFGARYFTPASEIPLAGHPTLATIRALIEARQIVLEGPTKTIALELKAGVIKVDIFQEGTDYQIVMAQKCPQFLSTHDRDTIAQIFGLSEGDLLTNAPVQTVSTGIAQLMIPIKNLEALKKAVLDVAAYKRYKSMSDFLSPHLFCIEGVTPDGSTFARHLGVPPDTTENAFTGSATGSMAAYLWHYGLIEKPNFIAEQGHWMGRAGCASVEVVGSRKDIKTVKVGGKAFVIAKGDIDI